MNYYGTYSLRNLSSKQKVNDNPDLDGAYAVNESYDALNDKFQGDYIERDDAHRIRHRNAKRILARVSFAGSSSKE